MCKITFLQFQNVFMDQLMLFQGAVFKNAVADVVLINIQDAQICAEMGVTWIVRECQVKFNNPDLKGIKTFIGKGEPSGTDIDGKQGFSLEPDIEFFTFCEVISEAFAFVSGVVLKFFSCRFLFFQEQIQPSCLTLCSLQKCSGQGAWNLHILLP